MTEAKKERIMDMQGNEGEASEETTTGQKIEAVRFEIEWAEGPIDEQREGRSADSWEDFDAILTEIAQGVKVGGCYEKVGFKITWADGTTYTGRYDVQNISHERAHGGPSLRAHVRAFTGYHSGLIKPDHLTEEDYAAHLKMHGEETRSEWYELARRYDVGVETPDDFEPGLPQPQMLTTETARLRQRVEVWQHPNVQRVGHQGETGTIQSLYMANPEPWTRPFAGVQVDGYGPELVHIPLAHLRELT